MLGPALGDLLVLGGHLRADGQHGRLLVPLHPVSLLHLTVDFAPLLGFVAVAGHCARPLIRTSHVRVGPRSATSIVASSSDLSRGRSNVLPSLIHFSLTSLKVQQHIIHFALTGGALAASQPYSSGKNIYSIFFYV